ncbi:hypothetical protein RJ640_000423 [Escallonia rubra]|uniref:Uncharacterized protein n=1 Tax=Escallonia rubra TaxID=112253 RepID=A0AA88QXY0_9ASTE|nr:hypothetical protein RJ640_000423 [Escallonia rubra]
MGHKKDKASRLTKPSARAESKFHLPYAWVKLSTGDTKRVPQDLIEGDSSKLEDMDARSWEKLNRKAVGLIRQWIDHIVFHLVTQEANAQTLCKKLESLYERKMAQNKAFLIKSSTSDLKDTQEIMVEWEEDIAKIAKRILQTLSKSFGDKIRVLPNF